VVTFPSFLLLRKSLVIRCRIKFDDGFFVVELIDLVDIAKFVGWVSNSVTRLFKTLYSTVIKGLGKAKNQ
jgi:hypothetical protein